MAQQPETCDVREFLHPPHLVLMWRPYVDVGMEGHLELPPRDWVCIIPRKRHLDYWHHQIPRRTQSPRRGEATRQNAAGKVSRISIFGDWAQILIIHHLGTQHATARPVDVPRRNFSKGIQFLSNADGGFARGRPFPTMLFHASRANDPPHFGGPRGHLGGEVERVATATHTL